MGLFDSPDEKLRKGLTAEAAGRAEKVCAVAQEIGGSLDFHKRRELEYVVFALWLRNQVAQHGPQIFASVTPAQATNILDQAGRISSHFTPAQGAAFDECVRHIRARPEIFEPPIASEFES